MQQNYYVYTHIRPDKNEIFYIGISKNLERPFVFNSGNRNKIWYNIFLKNNKKILVEIIHEFDTLEEAQLKEIELIKKYGRIFNNTGVLSNLAIGGEFSKKETKRINQYDLEGNFIKTWENVEEILKSYKITRRAIYRAIQNFTSCINFMWKFYEKDFSLKIENYNEIKFKKVYQFDRSLNLINTFDGVVKASIKTNIDQTSISACLSNRRETAGNFIWSYSKNLNKTYNILEKYSLEGTLINYYSTYEEAKKELNITSCTSIKNCTKGKQKTAYGHIWKWKEVKLQANL